MLKFYKNLSIRNKIIIVVLVISILTTTIGSLISFIYEISNFRTTIIQNTQTDANLISQYCIMPLEFNYPENAREVLEKLRSKEYIYNGLIFDLDDSLFASYHKENNKIYSYPPDIKEKRYILEQNFIHLMQPITYKDKLYGYIYLRAFTNIKDITLQKLYISIILILSMTLLAFLLAIYLQKYISDAIIQLTDFTNKIASTKNYSLRIKKQSNDETGNLYDEYNNMLDTIQSREKERDSALYSLKESEERFRSMITNIPGAIYQCVNDQCWTMHFISGAIEDITGYPASDFINNNVRSFASIIYPDDVEMVNRVIQEYLSDRKPHIIEYRIIHKSGEVIWVYEKGLGVFDQKDQLLFIDGAIFDITERKKSEKLQNSINQISESVKTSQNLNNLYHSIHLIINELMPAKNLYIAIHDPESDMLDFPYHVDELDTDWGPIKPGKSLTGYVLKTGETLLANTEILDNMINEGKLEPIGRTSNYWLGIPLKTQHGEIIGVMVVQTYHKNENLDTKHKDILMFVSSQIAMAIERKRAEENLLQSEEKFRFLFDTMAQGVIIQDSETRIIEANIAACEILGLSMDQMLGKTAYDPQWKLIHEDGTSLMPKEMPSNIALKTSKPVFNVFFGVYISSKKNYHWIIANSVPKFRKDENKPYITMTTFADVTERKHAEVALRESEEKYRELFEQTTDGILIIDSKGNYIDVNNGVCRMLGYTRSELLSKNMDRLVWSEDLEKQSDNVLRMFESENVLTECRMLCKNGVYINVELNAKRLPDGRFCAFVRDITERKKSELEQLRLQNLESLGILAGGIAHDFNNILTTILGRTSIALENIQEESVRNNLIAIETASKRAAGLTRQLLTFAKGGIPEKSIIEISKIIKDTTNFSLSGSNVSAEYDFNDTYNIEADASQISQVIQNLVINAKQAMPSGGKIRISTGNYEDMNEDKFVKITIADEGQGIPKEQLNKIFDPYFTTKQTGSGLGLSVCYSIIKRHEGSISVQSEIGKGSTFSILLQATTKSPELMDNIKNIIDKKLNILIMDDEEEVRELLTNMLDMSGHIVTASKEGGETIKIYKDAKEHGRSFDLIFLDLTVKGGMGGKETIRILREYDPNVKVIVSSGYSDNSMAHYKADGFSGILKKPYTMTELNLVIFEMMNQ